MNIKPFQALRCPLDGAPLQRGTNSWSCPAGHNFDIASQGYTHLLPVQKKRSLDPGDSKEMVAARRRFLANGVYKKIADWVNAATWQDLPESTTVSCLDAGCGEGYYLRQLAASAPPQLDIELLGLDISKWAILAAAKSDKNTNWIVGSNANLPAQTGSIDRLLCMFGFPVYPEFARVLKTNGYLLQVDAGPNHLRELREVIYPSLKPERPSKVDTPEGFTHQDSDHLQYTTTLNNPEQIGDLLAMTPHLFRATPEGRARAFALEKLTIKVDIKLTRLRRNSLKDREKPKHA